MISLSLLFRLTEFCVRTKNPNTNGIVTVKEESMRTFSTNIKLNKYCQLIFFQQISNCSYEVDDLNFHSVYFMVDYTFGEGVSMGIDGKKVLI